MEPTRAVVVCSAPRTGSGLLCSALWATGVCGRPDEYLGAGTRRDYEELWGCSGDDEYAAGVRAYATTPNGVLGIKVHWHQLPDASPWLAGGRPDPFEAIAPRVDYIWVRRHDKVRQAVSLYVAEQTGRYTLRDGDDPVVTDDVRFDADAIGRHLARAREWDACWQRYFDERGVQPTSIAYEDDLEDDYVATTTLLLCSLGIAVPGDVLVTTELHKQADLTSERLVQRFLDAGP